MSATIEKVEASIRNLEGDKRKASEDALSYLRYVASISGADISRWSIFPSFAQKENPGLLIEDKNEINRIFFEKLQKSFEKKKKDSYKEVKLDDLPGFAKLADETSIKYIKDKVLSIERAASGHASEARQQMDYATQQLSMAAQKYQEAQAMKGGDKTFGEKLRVEIQKILKTGVWTNPIVNTVGYMWFNTKSDIVVAYKNPAAGVDMEVNCGKLAVKLIIPNFQVLVYPYDNNRALMHNGGYYYHPHVDFYGRICWGNASAQIAEQLPKGDLAKVFELLYSLLFNYTDHHPYINLAGLKDTKFDYAQMYASLDYRHPDVAERIANPPKKKEGLTFEATPVIGPMPANQMIPPNEDDDEYEPDREDDEDDNEPF